MTVCNALEIYNLEDGIKDYKNNWNNHTLRIDSSRLIQKLRIANQKEAEMLDDRDDHGRIVFEVEEANKSLP
jgi:hypothetical protein